MRRPYTPIGPMMSYSSHPFAHNLHLLLSHTPQFSTKIIQLRQLNPPLCAFYE